MSPPEPRRPGVAQIMLGAFICWQLFFLITYNYLQLLNGPIEARSLRRDEPEGIAAQATLALQKAEYSWADLTGQHQAWWLFAFPPRESLFPLVELRWHDSKLAPVRLHAIQEPTDPSRYVRLPDPDDRLFHYENRCSVGFNPWDKQLQAEDPAKYDQRVEDQLKNAGRGWWRPALAYMRWRLQMWRDEHPDARAPDEVWLYCRAYLTPNPDEPWMRPAPVDRPLARWQPDRETPAGGTPIEVYDPRVAGFVPLSLPEAP